MIGYQTKRASKPILASVDREMSELHLYIYIKYELSHTDMFFCSVGMTNRVVALGEGFPTQFAAKAEKQILEYLDRWVVKVLEYSR